MGHLIICALASVAPGLGFWLLGERRRGTIIASIFAFFLFGNWIFGILGFGSSTKILLILPVGFWIVQLLITLERIYMRYQQIKHPEKAAVIPNKTNIANDLTNYHPSVQAAYQVVIAQPGIDRQLLLAAIFGIQISSRKAWVYIPYRILYLGLTHEFTIIVEADKLGTPMLIERLENSKIINKSYIQGSMNDQLKLEFRDGEIINLLVTIQQRAETAVFASMFIDA